MSDLCTACGFCCDGRLFSLAPLTESEIAWAKRKRLRIVTHSGTESLEQPCSALSGTRCTVYEERPRSCRAFKCVLLDKVARGETRLDEAIAIVERARAGDASLGDHFVRKYDR